MHDPNDPYPRNAPHISRVAPGQKCTIGMMDTMQIAFYKSANRRSSFSRLNFGQSDVDRLAPFPTESAKIVNIDYIHKTSYFQIMKRARNRKQLLTIPDNITAVSTRVTSLVRCNKFAEVESLLVRLPHTRAYEDNEEITRAKIALAWNNRDVQTIYKLIEVKP